MNLEKRFVLSSIPRKPFPLASLQVVNLVRVADYEAELQAWNEEKVSQDEKLSFQSTKLNRASAQLLKNPTPPHRQRDIGAILNAKPPFRLIKPPKRADSAQVCITYC